MPNIKYNSNVTIPRKAMKNRSIVSLTHRDRIPGTPAEYAKESIEIIKEMLVEAIGPLGGLRKFVEPGYKVVIKPNVVWTFKPETALNTDPRVVEALIELIKDQVPEVGEISIFEAPAAAWQAPISTLDCYEVAGIANVARRLNVRLVDGEKEESTPVKVPGATVQSSFDLSKTLREADCLIAVPKLKTHTQTGMTGAVKIMLGALKGYDKRKFHGQGDLPQKLVDIHKAIRPDLAIIDALWVLQGQGPISLFPEDLLPNLNLLITSEDCVAADAVASAIMGLDPFEVETTRIGHHQGIGVGLLDDIDVRGVSIESVKRPFKRASSDLTYVYPNIAVYMHGSCSGCAHTVRHGLDKLTAEGVLKRLTEPVNIVIGFKTSLPKGLDRQRTLVVGDCTADHKEDGTYFFPGCPHLPSIYTVAEVIRAMVDEGNPPDFSYLPPDLQPVKTL
jgi:uncharacterized protein (DUF362 family)